MTIARMMLESDAIKLGAWTPAMFADAAREGANPRIVSGLQAARDALFQHVNEADLDQLFAAMGADIRAGLSALDAKSDV
jgi:hypothetical protein